jgi:hypothetical protein
MRAASGKYRLLDQLTPETFYSVAKVTMIGEVACRLNVPYQEVVDYPLLVRRQRGCICRFVFLCISSTLLRRAKLMTALDVYCLYTYFELITRALLNIMSNLELAIEQGFSFEHVWCRQVHPSEDMAQSAHFC